MRIQENMIEFNPLSIKGQKALSKLVSAMRKHNVNEEIINMYMDERHFLDEFYIEPFTRINEENWTEDSSAGFRRSSTASTEAPRSRR